MNLAKLTNDGRYTVSFNNPQMVGALKDILVLPPEHEYEYLKKQERLQQLKTVIDLARTKIKETDETDVISAYEESIKDSQEEMMSILTNKKYLTKNKLPFQAKCRIAKNLGNNTYEVNVIFPKHSYRQQHNKIFSVTTNVETEE